MSLHVAPLTTQVWNDYAAMWASRGLTVPGPERPGIYVQNDAGVLMGGIQSFPTDGAWVFLEHLAVVQGLSDEESARVVRFMIQVCKGYSAVVCKKVIILSGPDWCNTLLAEEGFEQQGLTPFIYTPAPLPLKASVQDPQVAQLKAELARAQAELEAEREDAHGRAADAAEHDRRALAASARAAGKRVRGMLEEGPREARNDLPETDAPEPDPEGWYEQPQPEPYTGTESTTAVDDDVRSAKELGMTVEAYRAMVAEGISRATPAEEPAPPKKKKPRTPKQLAADERMRKKK